MAKLPEALAAAFPAVDESDWNRWQSWFAWWLYREDSVLVIFDPDGDVHLRLWRDDQDPGIFASHLTSDQYAFRVLIVQKAIERIREQSGYPWIALTAMESLEWSVIATQDAFAIRQGRSAYYWWTWYDLGQLFRLANLSQDVHTEQSIFPDMLKIVLHRGTHVMIERLTVLRQRLAYAEEGARERESEILRGELKQSLAAQKQLIEELRRLSDDFDALPGANTTAMLMARLKVLRRLQEATRVEYDSPGYFDSVRNDCEQKIAKCERLIAAHTARNSRARK